jgi:hypothetical protein
MDNAFIHELSADNFVGNTITATSITLATGIEDSVDYSTLSEFVNGFSTITEDMLLLSVISGETVDTLPGLENGVTNFNTRNDRISEIPADPVIATDGTSIDYTFNSDNTCNIEFSWSFIGEDNEHNVDGFIIYLKDDNYDVQHTISEAHITEYHYFQVDTDKRTAKIMSLTPDKYYTIGIESFRIVDQDITTSGILRSNIVQSEYVSEDPVFLSRIVEPPNTITIQEL